MNGTVSSDKIIPMLDLLIKHEDVHANAKSGFLASIREFHTKKGYLTQGQYTALERMYNTYSQDTSEWRKNFDDEKKKIFNICVDFYKMSKYYGSIIDKVRKNPGYIPSEKEYRAMCENKYALVLIREHNAPPRFALGSMVRLRKRPEYGIGNVIEIQTGLTVAVRGGKRYKVYFPNMENPVEMQERNLASVRDCDLKKMADMGEVRTINLR